MLLLERLVQSMEALLFSADTPVSTSEFADFFATDTDTIEQALAVLQENYRHKTLEIKQTASGWRFVVHDDYNEVIARFHAIKPKKLSPALMETLAVIAYSQPVTRADIEEVRGVSTSQHIMSVLLNLGWIKQSGRKGVLGRPALFSTTKQLLDDLGICSIKELPKPVLPEES